eukprot:SAG11_NODE_8027_length_1068_cov_1.058824_1_plen_215_part_10
MARSARSAKVRLSLTAGVLSCHKAKYHARPIRAALSDEEAFEFVRENRTAWIAWVNSKGAPKAARSYSSIGLNPTPSSFANDRLNDRVFAGWAHKGNDPNRHTAGAWRQFTLSIIVRQPLAAYFCSICSCMVSATSELTHACRRIGASLRNRSRPICTTVCVNRIPIDTLAKVSFGRACCAGSPVYSAGRHYVYSRGGAPSESTEPPKQVIPQQV